MKMKMLLVLAGSLLFCFQLQSQSDEKTEKNPLYVLHTDYVKPSMVAEYNKLCKDLVATLNKHEISNMNYMCFSDNNFKYGFLTPIESMADLDRNEFKTLKEKMGEEAYEKMWEPWGKCYSKHTNVVVGKSLKHSYSPEIDPQDDESLTYREWAWYYMLPEKSEEGWQLAEEWKDLYTAKKIPNGYRVYYGVLGTDDPMLVVVRSAKDRPAMEQLKEKEMEMLGEEGRKLWEKTMKVIRKMETTTGEVHPELSYNYKEVKSKTAEN